MVQFRQEQDQLGLERLLSYGVESEAEPTAASSVQASDAVARPTPEAPAASIWLSRGGQKEADVSLESECLNVSESGLMLRVPKLIEVESEIRFRVPGLELEGSGTVLQCGNFGDSFMVAVRFAQRQAA